MKSQIVVAALTCLAATACGGQDTRPAQTSSSTHTTAAAPYEPPAYEPPAYEAPAQVVPTPSSATDAPRSTPGTATATTTRTPGYSDSSATTARTDNGTGVVAPPAVSPGPAVVNNPGVADRTKSADNTKINDRDRHGALTPMDQGNSGNEIKITAAIRRGIMGDKSLSFTAKNVKVITVGSKVTLRGPVNSDREKASIEVLTKQTAGVSEVDNQLEVKK